jgi:hypothetical protein
MARLWYASELHEYPSNNKLSKIVLFTMKCIVIKQSFNLLISNFTIFESLLFEGYSCKRLQTLYTY